VSERRIATVLMLDVVGSTGVAAELGDARYRELASRFARIVRAALRRSGGREEDHAGDGFFATFAQPDRAIRCAAEIADEVRALGIEVRCGIHTGQTETLAGKTQGIAVVIGARVMSLAGAGEVLVTSTAKELATGSGIGFGDPVAHELKGVPGTWLVHAVTSIDRTPRAESLAAAEAAKRRATIEPTTGRQRRGIAALASGVAIATLAAIAVLLFGPDEQEPRGSSERRTSEPRTGSVVQLDADTARALTTIPAATRNPVPGQQPPAPPHGIVVGQGAVWVVRIPGVLVHVDPHDRDVRARVTLEGSLSFSVNVAEGAGGIWVSTLNGLSKVNPATDEHRLIVGIPEGAGTADVVFGEGHVWVGTGAGRLLRFAPRTGREQWVDDLPPIDQIAVGHGAVWTIDVVGSTVTRYDPETMGQVASIPVDGGVDALVVGEEGIWVLSRGLGALTRIDPISNEPAQVAQVGSDPTVATAARGTIWVGDEDGSIRRVDEATRDVAAMPFGAEIRAITFDDETDTLWVDVA
jgi:class 3 adenylate cyclase/outer membrane protein assembly factor BamB